MNDIEMKSEPQDLFNQKNYGIESLEDEIRVDQICKALLKEYHHYLLESEGISPLDAGSMASGSDYYLRDFMIDNRRTNIFIISPELIYSFAGNWYIINTLEPNLVELETILIGIDNFYRFCAAKKIIDPILAEEIAQACSRHDYYQQRIESFNKLSDDGFTAWNNECPLR